MKNEKRCNLISSNKLKCSLNNYGKFLIIYSITLFAKKFSKIPMKIDKFSLTSFIQKHSYEEIKRRFSFLLNELSLHKGCFWKDIMQNANQQIQLSVEILLRLGIIIANLYSNNIMNKKINKYICI